ncbi:MAG: PQQ-binding-like beta-propeller repeat protein, partial [Acidobacteriota bacterium]
IDVESGAPRWVAAVTEDAKTTTFAPVVDRDLVAVAYTRFVAPNQGGVVALDPRTGRERWRRSFPRATFGLGTGAAGGPVLVGRLVVASSGDGTIYGLDRRDGSIRWSIPALEEPAGRRPAVPQADFRALALSGGRLIAGSLSGTVVAYSLGSRVEEWRSDVVRASVAFGLAADAQSVYVPFLSGDLVALNSLDGRERWRVGGSADGFVWTPLVDDRRVYAAGSRAGFVAFRK